jgi:serine/threonine-protein phosphatase 2A regulatory subunit B
LNLNKFVTNNFLSSDEFRVFLWDVNSNNSDVYVPINIEIEDENINNIEKITKAKYSNFDPHIFFYGTNKGLIKLCDLRTNSEQIKFETNYSDTNSNLKDIIGNSLLSIHDICSSYNNENNFVTRHYFNINIWDIRKQNEPISKFLIYEPIIKELQYLYQNNYLNDKFTIDSDINGKYILTGGYNNMFHIFDIEQKLNTQMVIDETNDKLMNTNIIRKINSKGSCSYKNDEISVKDINYEHKISHQIYSPIGNYILVVDYDRIYSYIGNSGD